MKKLMGTAKALDIIANVIQVLCMVAGIMLAVAAALLLLFDIQAFEFTSSIELGSFSIELGSFSFELASADPSIFRVLFLWTALPAIGSVAVMWLALRIVRRLLAPMREGKPFDSAVSRNLRTLSWIALIGGAVCSIMKIIAEVAMFKLYNFPALFQNESITHCTYNAEPDTGFVLVFLILFLLSCVFRYGEELQRQSDETL